MKVIQHKIYNQRSKSTAKTILKPIGLKQQPENILKKPQQIMKSIIPKIHVNPNNIIMIVQKFERNKPKLNIQQPCNLQELQLQVESSNQCKVVKMKVSSLDQHIISIPNKIQFQNSAIQAKYQVGTFQKQQIKVRQSKVAKISNPSVQQIKQLDIQTEKANNIINKSFQFVPLQPAEIQVKQSSIKVPIQTFKDTYSIKDVHQHQITFDQLQQQLQSEVEHNYKIQIDIFIQLLEQNNKSMLEVILKSHKKQCLEFIQQYEYIKINYLDYLNSQINTKKIKIKFLKEDPHSTHITIDNDTFINNVNLETNHYIKICQDLYDEQYKKFKNPAAIIVESLILFEKKFKEIIQASTHIKISKLLLELQESYRKNTYVYLLDYKQIQVNFTAAENQIKSLLEEKCNVSSFEKSNYIKQMKKATDCDQLYEIINVLQTTKD